MQFVIELYKLACSTAERKVVCRGWKKMRRSQLGLPSNPSWAVGGQNCAQNEIGTTILPREPSHMR
jgi:hypothetical protein